MVDPIEDMSDEFWRDLVIAFCGAGALPVRATRAELEANLSSSRVGLEPDAARAAAIRFAAGETGLSDIAGATILPTKATEDDLAAGEPAPRWLVVAWQFAGGRRVLADVLTDFRLTALA